ncbi:type I-E CRISPR-associated protein Cse2/CasB [Streptomyces sp. NPDC002516]
MTFPASAPVAPKKPARPSDQFVAYVHELCDSNGTRAALRRGLGLPVERCNYLHRFLVPWVPERVHPDAKRAHYAVAALIAARPRAARDTTPVSAENEGAAASWYARPNLGAALGHAVNKKVLKPTTAESTLHLMCRQSTGTIHPALPALTRQLLNGGITIDWAVLLEDLAWWNRDRDRIATRWLEAYFRTTSAEQTPADTITPQSSDVTEENDS